MDLGTRQVLSLQLAPARPEIRLVLYCQGFLQFLEFLLFQVLPHFPQFLENRVNQDFRWSLEFRMVHLDLAVLVNPEIREFLGLLTVQLTQQDPVIQTDQSDPMVLQVQESQTLQSLQPAQLDQLLQLILEHHCLLVVPGYQ